MKALKIIFKILLKLVILPIKLMYFIFTIVASIIASGVGFFLDIVSGFLMLCVGIYFITCIIGIEKFDTNSVITFICFALLAGLLNSTVLEIVVDFFIDIIGSAIYFLDELSSLKPRQVQEEDDTEEIYFINNNRENIKLDGKNGVYVVDEEGKEYMYYE